MLLFVVPSTYPNSVNPGSGSFVYEQTLELSRLGHDHDIVILDVSEYNYHHWLRKSCRYISRTYGEEGIRYKLHSRGLMTSRFPKRAVTLAVKNVRKLYTLAVKENGKPDVIITHFTLPAGFAALKLAKEENIPCVIVEHYSLLLSDKLQSYMKSELTGAVKDSAAFICVSESLKLAIERHTGIIGKIQIVSNMTDRRFTYSLPREQPPFVFFSAGNLNKNKRFDLLIDSFCKAFPANERVLLRIAGKGGERGKLTQIINENGRERQIQLLGWVPRDMIAAEYRNCHCFVLLSRRETFGIVYREAMATGRPVVSTRNGGIEEGWEDGNGIITDDVLSIPIALKCIRNNYCSFNGLDISRRCLSSYSPDVVIQRLEKIIYEAAEKLY